ncbi:alpha/beta-hydrolase [Amylocystis lapponica]|nr:alpha/beta-hydrolase [Amylocystis lapponica]
MVPALSFNLLWTLLPPLLFTALCNGAPTDVPSAASFYVPTLPDLHQDPARPLHIFAGHVSSDPNLASAPVTEVTPHIYFVMVKARRAADKERLMFWFNGGPGCSSFDGLMMEVGPWRVDGNGGLNTTEGGWEEYTTMVYVDQPVGTGFSYTATNKLLHDLSDASTQFVQFLENWYKIFPEYRIVDTYLGGESYAGQYIPYFADAVLKSSLNIPLRGAAIGNGWIDGRHQYPAYLDYAVKHGLVEENSDDWKHSKSITDSCMQEFARVAETADLEPVKVDVCESVMGEVVAGRSRKVDGKDMCVNIYDVRLEDTSPACGMNWPPDLKDIYTYLARKDVVQALHATSKSETWTECNGRVHSNFNTHKSPSSITVIPGVLEKIPIMLFAGDQDLICNYVGIESMMQAMTWNGETGLGTVSTQSWTVDGTPAGTWVTSRNLTYVKLFNASHMAGFDVPHVTHDMILRFMGMNFSAITDGSARIPSSVGEDVKPIPALLDTSPSPNPAPAKTPEQDKAMWEAYYNAGSAALVLVLIALVVAGFLWWRSRRQRLRGLPVSTQEESIPLNSHVGEGNGNGMSSRSEEDLFRNRKGKERAGGRTPEEAIFSVGDSDDEEEGRTPRTGA